MGKHLISTIRENWNPSLRLKLAKDTGEETERTNRASDERLADTQQILLLAVRAQDQKGLQLIEEVQAFKDKVVKGAFHKHQYELVELSNDILYQVQAWYQRHDAQGLPDGLEKKLHYTLSKFKKLYDHSLPTDRNSDQPSRWESFKMDAELNLIHIPRIEMKHAPGRIRKEMKKKIGDTLNGAKKALVKVIQTRKRSLK